MVAIAIIQSNHKMNSIPIAIINRFLKTSSSEVIYMNQEPAQNLSGDILVVDDELDNLKLFSTVLSNRGYRVRQATNGEIAMRDSVLVQHLDLLHMQSLCSDISFVSVIFWVG